MPDDPALDPLHSETIATLESMLAEAKAGKLTALVAVAGQPRYAYWIVCGKMNRRDKMNIIGQLEYLKWSLIQSEED